MTSGDKSLLQPLAKFLVELPPRVRWHTSALQTRLTKSAYARIGSGSVINSPLKVQGAERIAIGSDVAIYDGAWLATEGASALTFGDGVYVGHHSHFHAVDDITIGDRVMFADYVYVGTGMHKMGELHVTHGSGPISIGAGSFIGQRAVILGGVTIGERATVGAGSVVTKDVPAGVTVAGVPARIISGG